MESKSNQPKNSIIAINLSKSWILVYAENKHKNNEESKNKDNDNNEENLVTIIFFQKKEEEEKSTKETTNKTISLPSKFGKITNLLITHDEKSLLVTNDILIYIYSISEMKIEGKPIEIDFSKYWKEPQDKTKKIIIMTILEWTYNNKECLYVWGNDGKAYLMEDYKQGKKPTAITPLASGRDTSFVVDDAGTAIIFVEALVSLTTIVICKIPFNNWHKVQIKEAHSEPITALCFCQKQDPSQRLKFLSGDKGNVIKIWQFPNEDIKKRKEEKLQKNTIDMVALAEISGVHFVGEVYSLDCFEENGLMHVL